VNISSIAGLAPIDGAGLYAASKCALEGVSESLAQEVAPLGLSVAIVEPGTFRTDFLSAGSTQISAKRIDEYAGTSGKSGRYPEDLSGKQAGDPARGARTIIEAVEPPDPPLRLLLGTDALSRAPAKVDQLGEDFDRWERTTISTDYAEQAS
jgi:NAD(P)-dependent dehydrogenase (short-subunit alcohol dehydrogenase family)